MTSTAPKAHTLDHYHLLRRLGEGGMGEVWAARDTLATGLRIVAVKTTKQNGQEAAKVLFDEARIASLISHPNVCKVQEHRATDGLQYLVMDWCDGATLFDVIQSRVEHTIPYPLAAKIVAEAAAGLHAAHELRDENDVPLHVVHRDVSPQNILISTAGTVTISDFGVAKARGQVHQATQTGEVKGKLSYMAPEQVRSRDVDRRADIFALGCVLYLATVGSRPFTGNDAMALMYKILESDVETPSKLVEQFPPALEGIIMRCLAKDRDQRYQTAHELQIALELYLREQSNRITARDIAAMVDASLGPVIRVRNEQIFRLARGDSETEVTDTLIDGRVPETDSKIDTVATRTIEGSTILPPKTRLLPWIGSVVAIGAATAFVILRPVGPQAKATVAAQQQPAEASILISARVFPSDAQILVDGQLSGTGMMELEEKSSPGTITLRFVREGFVTVERAVRKDRSHNLEITLSPVPTANPVPPAPLGQPNATKPRSTGAGRKSAPVTPASRPTGPAKPARPLDTADPFRSSQP